MGARHHKVEQIVVLEFRHPVFELENNQLLVPDILNVVYVLFYKAIVHFSNLINFVFILSKVLFEWTEIVWVAFHLYYNYF